MAALAPDQYDEMIEASRKALYRVMPDKAAGVVGGLSITLVRALMNAAENLLIHQGVDPLDSTFSKWINAGIVSQCKRTIHDIYYGLHEQGLIE